MDTSQDSSLVKIYEVNNCLIDLRLHEIARESDAVRPDPDVFQTLVYLIEHRDHVVALDEFRISLWHDRDVSEFEIARNIMLARRAILDEEQHKVIAFVPEKNGYQLIGDVLELEID